MGLFLESPLRVLQHDIRIVIGKDNSIHISGDGYEQSAVGEFFDSALK